MKISLLRLGFLVSFGVSVVAPAFAQQRVVVSIEDLSRPTGDTARGPNTVPAAFPLWYAFHDGDLDVFDVGQLASAELGALATEALPLPLIEKMRSEHPAATVNFVANNFYGPDNGLDPTNYQARTQILAAGDHEFFSFAAKVAPSDDAFIGNDDPRKIRVFDQQGRFLGPIIIDVYGDEVLDAGVRVNDETDVLYVINRIPDLSAGVPSQDPIGLHPGYNGSVANPSGVPVGILGVAGDICDIAPDSTSCFHIDTMLGDFKRPKYPIARIRITSGWDASLSGLWYNLSFAGEGYSFTVYGAEPSLAVGAYTYKPDDSGEQLWLFGNAPMTGRTARVDLFQTSGGQFGSVDNPENVEATKWGHLDVAFISCEEAIVQIYPLSPDYVGFGDDQLIFLERSTPPGAGLERACFSPGLNVAEPDNSWPNPEDIIEPQP